MQNFLFFSVVVFFSYEAAMAQADPVNASLPQIIDEIYEETTGIDNESPVYDYYENLSQTYNEINTIGINELLKIPFIDFSTANSIISYREKTGYIFSFRELFSIADIDTTILRYIAPFISVNYKSKVADDEYRNQHINISYRSRVLFDMQKRRGFAENKYAGNKIKSLQKFMLGFGRDFRFSFLAKKDPGENSFTDYTSFYFFMRNNSIIRNLIIGDYSPEYGKGLLFGGNFPVYRSINVISQRSKPVQNIIPYSGSAENGFFRGAAITLGYKAFSLDLFYSSNKFDASIDTAAGIITSIPITGYHRTVTEIKNKKSASEKLFGISTCFTNKFINAGILFYYSTLSNKLEKEKPCIPDGTDLKMTSLYYDIIFEELNISGETAFNGSVAAHYSSLQFNTNRNISFVIAIRNYPENFFSFHGNTPGSNGITNENGIYTGTRIKTGIGNFSLSYDQNKSYRPTGAALFPDKGNEFGLTFSSNKIKEAVINFRVSHSNSERTISGISEIETSNRIRLQLSDVSLSQFQLKWNICYTDYKQKYSGFNETGYALIQDVVYRAGAVLNLYGRVAFFSTGSFSTAIYTYETDLPGMMANAVLYDKGERYFILINYNPLPGLSLNLKYSETFKPGEDSIGSGDNEIFTNVDNKISFQLDLRL